MQFIWNEKARENVYPIELFDTMVANRKIRACLHSWLDMLMESQHILEIPQSKVAGLVRNSRETIRRLPITSDAKLRLRDLAKLCLVLSRSFSRPTELTGSLANINKADQLIRHVIPRVDAGDSPTVAARSFSTPMSGAEQMDIHVPAGKASRCLPGAAGAAAHQ